MTDSAQPRDLPNLPPAGWHPDPSNPGELLWWDGTAWTGARRPAKRGGTARIVWAAVLYAYALVQIADFISQTLIGNAYAGVSAGAALIAAAGATALLLSGLKRRRQ